MECKPCITGKSQGAGRVGKKRLSDTLFIKCHVLVGHLINREGTVVEKRAVH